MLTEHKCRKIESYCFSLGGVRIGFPGISLANQFRWISLLEEKHISIEDGLSTKINFDTSNARDFQNIAGMVFCCHGLPNEPVPTSSQVQKWLSTQEIPPEQFKNEIEDVLRTMWVIGSEGAFNEGFVNIEKKVAPIEFIFIGEYTSLYSNTQ